MIRTFHGNIPSVFFNVILGIALIAVMLRVFFRCRNVKKEKEEEEIWSEIENAMKTKKKPKK